MPQTNAAAIVERVVEARVSGYPDRWQKLSRACDELLARLPPARLRGVASRCLAGDDESRAWAIDQLLGPAYDPKVDPPRVEVAAAFARDPSMRAIMLLDTERCSKALPVFREALRRGELAVDEARKVLTAIDSVWGGMSEIPDFAFLSFERRKRRGKAVLEPRGRADALAAVADFADDASWRVPVTEDEWTRSST